MGRRDSIQRQSVEMSKIKNIMPYFTKQPKIHLYSQRSIQQQRTSKFQTQPFSLAGSNSATKITTPKPAIQTQWLQNNYSKAKTKLIDSIKIPFHRTGINVVRMEPQPMSNSTLGLSEGSSRQEEVTSNQNPLENQQISLEWTSLRNTLNGSRGSDDYSINPYESQDLTHINQGHQQATALRRQDHQSQQFDSSTAPLYDNLDQSANISIHTGTNLVTVTSMDINAPNESDSEQNSRNLHDKVGQSPLQQYFMIEDPPTEQEKTDLSPNMDNFVATFMMDENQLSESLHNDRGLRKISESEPIQRDASPLLRMQPRSQSEYELRRAENVEILSKKSRSSHHSFHQQFEEFKHDEVERKKQQQQKDVEIAKARISFRNEIATTSNGNESNLEKSKTQLRQNSRMLGLNQGSVEFLKPLPKRYRNEVLKEQYVAKSYRTKSTPFRVMTPYQKKKWIAYLWGRVRDYVRAKKFITNIRSTMDQNWLLQFSQLEKYDPEQIVQSQQQQIDALQSRPKYLLYKGSSKFLQIWDSLMSISLSVQLYFVTFFIAIEPFETNIEAKAMMWFQITEGICVIDFILKWLKAPESMENPTLKKTSLRYLKRTFILDFLATVVSDIMFFTSLYKWAPRLKLLRLARINEMRRPYIHGLRNFMPSAAPPKVRDVYEQISNIALFTLFITHILICIWIRLGAYGYKQPVEERTSWLFLSSGGVFQKDELYNEDGTMQSVFDQCRNPEKNGHYIELYFYVAVFILQTITTVGYGNTSYESSREYIFVMLLESGCIVYSGYLLSTILTLLKLQSIKFKEYNESYNDCIDKWITKMQRVTPGFYMSPNILKEVDFIKKAFLNDHKIIIDDFDLYQSLTPPMQSEIINIVFADFIEKFNHFLGLCETGIRNELIIQMHIMSYKQHTVVLPYGKRFDKLYFIMDGQVDLITKGHVHFLEMYPGQVFGDYGCLFNLRSNIQWQTPDDMQTDQELEDTEGCKYTNIMCCDKQIFTDLCELYPKTHSVLKELALEKRDIIQFFHQKVSKIVRKNISGVPVGLSGMRRNSPPSDQIKVNHSAFNSSQSLPGRSKLITPNDYSSSKMLNKSQAFSLEKLDGKFQKEEKLHEFEQQEEAQSMTLEKAKKEQLQLINDVGKQKLIELSIANNDPHQAQFIEQGKADYLKYRQMASTERNQENTSDLNRDFKKPEFLPEEDYQLSRQEKAVLIDEGFKYTLNVVHKIEKVLYTIYMVQRMRKKRVRNTTKILNEKLVSVISTKVHERNLMKTKTSKEIAMNSNSDSEVDSYDSLKTDLDIANLDLGSSHSSNSPPSKLSGDDEKQEVKHEDDQQIEQIQEESSQVEDGSFYDNDSNLYQENGQRNSNQDVLSNLSKVDSNTNQNQYLSNQSLQDDSESSRENESNNIKISVVNSQKIMDVENIQSLLNEIEETLEDGPQHKPANDNVSHEESPRIMLTRVKIHDEETGESKMVYILAADDQDEIMNNNSNCRRSDQCKVRKEVRFQNNFYN